MKYSNYEAGILNQVAECACAILIDTCNCFHAKMSEVEEEDHEDIISVNSSTNVICHFDVI